MVTKYERCIAEGKYKTISPGEVCTLSVGSTLGVMDPVNYFKNNTGYEDVMTYNSEKDESENRSSQICSYTSNANFAYASCSVQGGVGFTRKLSDPSQCVTFSCPPGFEGSGSTCKKPLEDFAISKLARCDERWYDWFMVPNYHLGNKYFTPKPGQCYKPCPEYYVPQYSTDPVDETGAGPNMKERLDRCVARNDYMSGKYEKGSDYCPIAWIHRLTAFPTTVRQDYLLKLQEYAESKRSDGTMNDYYVKLRDTANVESDVIAREAGSLLENITALSDTQVEACRGLNNPERLTKAYDICARLSEDDTWYTDKLETELGDPEVKRVAKTKMLKQACNAIFCSPTDNSNEEIGKPQVCSQIVGEVEVPPDQEEKDRDPPYVDGGKSYFNSSISTAFTLVMVGIFGTMFVLFLIYFLWPKVIVPIFRFIYNLFSRYKMKRNKIDELKADLKPT